MGWSASEVLADEIDLAIYDVLEAVAREMPDTDICMSILRGINAHAGGEMGMHSGWTPRELDPTLAAS